MRPRGLATDPVARELAMLALSRGRASGAANQPTWYLNDAGSSSADGLSPSKAIPIATWRSRLGPSPMVTVPEVNVFIAGTSIASPLYLSDLVIASGSRVNLKFTGQAVLASGSIASMTYRNTAPTFDSWVAQHSSGAFDWNPYLKQRIRFPAMSAFGEIGVSAGIAKDLGGGRVRLTSPTYYDRAVNPLTPQSLGLGQFAFPLAFEVYRLPRLQAPALLGALSTGYIGDASFTFAGIIAAYDVDFDTIYARDNVVPIACNARYYFADSGGAYLVNSTISITGGVSSNTNLNFGAGGIYQNVYLAIQGYIAPDECPIFQGPNTFDFGSTWRAGLLDVHSGLGVFDQTATPFRLTAGAMVRVTSDMYGNGNAASVFRVGAGGVVELHSTGVVNTISAGQTYVRELSDGTTVTTCPTHDQLTDALSGGAPAALTDANIRGATFNGNARGPNEGKIALVTP